LTLDSEVGDVVFTSSQRTDDANAQLVECVERGLNHYGLAMTRVVFWNFEMQYGFQKEDIWKSPEKFVQSIQGMFAGGAASVEKTIIQEMKSSLASCDLDDSSLSMALKQARAFFQRNSEN
jgi:hypothetical protein